MHHDEKRAMKMDYMRTRRMYMVKSGSLLRKLSILLTLLLLAKVHSVESNKVHEKTMHAA
jgi:hypothetical protein